MMVDASRAKRLGPRAEPAKNCEKVIEISGNPI